MNAPAIRTFRRPVVNSCLALEGGAWMTLGVRPSEEMTFDEGDATIPTVLGFATHTRAELSEPALVAYRIGSARGRALGAVLRDLAEHAPLDRT